MSDDLPNQNNNLWNPPQSPHNGNNTVDPVQSWVAQHEQRDSSGKFVSSEYKKVDSQTPPNSPNTPNHPNIPLPVSFTQNSKYSEKNDPPLVAVSVTNPVTYLKLFLKRFLKNEGIDIHLKIKPLTVIGMIAALSISFGAGFNVAQIFFPTSSPILHREVAYQGTVQKTQDGKFYLSLIDNSLWILRPTVFYSNFNNLVNKQVLLKGNLTADKNVIEVKEVNIFDAGENRVHSLPIIINPSATISAQEKN